MTVRALLALSFAVGVTACVAPPKPADYTAFRSEDPHSVLVVPALNNTVSVEAPEFFLSTVSRPFAERGYYVFPANMVKSVLERDGLSDAGLVHQADPRRMGRLFGCDTVLYIEIEKWESQYAVLATSTNVAFDYSLKSCKTGDVLWTNHQTWTYSPQSNSSGNIFADLIVAAVVAGVEKAAPNYIPLAQQANLMASTQINHGLPAGPYRKETYGKDQAQFPSQSTEAK